MNEIQLNSTDSLPQRPPIKRRSSYSMNNALRFKPAFDQAVNNINKSCNPEDKAVLVTFAGSTLEPVTLKQRMNEALRWLIDNYELLPTYEKAISRDAYAVLRGMIRLKFTPTGILIAFGGFEGTKFLTSAITSETTRVKWKTELEQFLANDEIMFRRSGLLLTDEDQAWARRMLADPSIEYTVTATDIVAAKAVA